MNTTLNCLALLVLIGSLVEIVAVDLAAGQAVDVDTSPFRMSRNLLRSYQAIGGCPRSAWKLARLCYQSCISKSSPDCIEWKEKLFKCCERECTCEDQNQIHPGFESSTSPSLKPSSAPSKAPSAISECPRSAWKLGRLCNQSCISKSSPDCIEWKEKLFKCCERECTCEDQNQLDPALLESSLEPSSAPSKAPSVGGPSTGGVDPEPGVGGPSTGGVDPEPSTELPDLNGRWKKNKPCVASCP